MNLSPQAATPAQRAAYDELVAVAMKHINNDPLEALIVVSRLTRLAVALSRSVFIKDPCASRDYLVSLLNQHLKDVESAVPEKYKR